jgi:type II secretory pathway component GspD/PulD (secretin)
MKARFAVAFLVAGLLAACGGNPARLETRTFALHYLAEGQVHQLLGPYVDTERPAARGSLTVGSGTVTVRETPDNLDRIGRVLAQFDRPQPSVRLTFKVIRADGAARADSSIADVESALRSLFRFRGYALVAEGIMTGTENSRSQQMLDGDGGPYRLTALIRQVSGGGDSAAVQLTVELSNLAGGTFETTVRVSTGKTAVLGNVMGGNRNSALILTVRPDLMPN